MLDPSTISIEETDDAVPTSSVQSIPLEKLMLSNLNVRQTERDSDIASLAEDIAARGLKQNLVVIAAHFSSGDPQPEHMNGEPAASGGKNVWQDRFEVIAGGRRFQAMQLLVADGRLPADHAVPCLIEARDQARETSLSENLQRVAMNPADEFEAYAHIVDQAKHEADPIAYCARRFGTTVKHVEGRLRLAALAPEILQALRENKLGLESAKAYARTSDHKLQLKVFADHEKNSWKKHNPEYIRSDLAGKTRPLDHASVTFVGLEAYRDAGGRTEIEMFMGTDGAERIVDVPLLDKLAKAKGEEMVAAQAKTDGFKNGLFANGIGHSASWPKPPVGMERTYSYYDSKAPTKAQLKKCVAVYAIDPDGLGLQKVGHFKPAEKRDTGPERNWEAERQARERETMIEQRAARLAVYDIGKFTGTPFEGHAFWPNYSARAVSIEPDEEFALVAVQVRVPVSSIQAHRAEAEKQYDEELAAAAAAKAAAAEQTADAGSDELEAAPDQILSDYVDDELDDVDEDEGE